MNYDIYAVYDTEVMTISDNVFAYMTEDEMNLSFFISVGGIEELVSKNFYVELKHLGKFPVRKGRVILAQTSDGEDITIWDLKDPE